jgi:hypothetical protein
VRFVPSIILLNKAALVEQYYRFIHADASAGNEGILEDSSGKEQPLIYPLFLRHFLIIFWQFVR